MVEHMCHSSSPTGVNFKEAPFTQGPNSLHMVNATDRKKKKQVAEQVPGGFWKLTLLVFFNSIFSMKMQQHV